MGGENPAIKEYSKKNSKKKEGGALSVWYQT